jgi:hypothetical protein
VSRAATLATLAAMPAELAAAVRAADGRPMPPGEWSPSEVVRHLIAVESDVHQARLHDLETVDDPRGSWVEPPPWTGEPGLSVDHLLARFAARRDVTLASLGALHEAGWAGPARTRASARST